jgi:hypothetical protein
MWRRELHARARGAAVKTLTYGYAIEGSVHFEFGKPEEWSMTGTLTVDDLGGSDQLNMDSAFFGARQCAYAYISGQKRGTYRIRKLAVELRD